MNNQPTLKRVFFGRTFFKTFIFAARLMVCAILLLPWNNTYGQSQNQIDQAEPFTTPIHIIVKVDELFSRYYPEVTTSTIDSLTRITGPGNSPNGNYGGVKRNYETPVNRNVPIIWQISFEDNNQRDRYLLELVLINRKNGETNQFFTPPELLPTNGIILGVPTSGAVNSLYQYYILFTITERSSGDYNSYIIDPQLKMN